MKNSIKYILYSPVDFLILIYAVVFFSFTNKTPFAGYKSMLRLYCIYGGIITDCIGYLTKDKINKTTIDINDEDTKLKEIINNLNDKGYHVYNNFLSGDEIKELSSLIKESKFALRQSDADYDNNKNLKDKKNIFFDEYNPERVLYEFDRGHLINQTITQKILAKKDFYSIASKYFNSTAYLDHISLSISTDYNKASKIGDSNAAQLYHFDLDRPKWLKFLIYINDVNDNNGPHCYIENTHKNYSIPFKIMSRGYKRIEQFEIDKLFKKEKQIKFIESAGTAIIEDTKGLHKGEKLKKGYRVLLNIQFNNSMFGGPYEKLIFKEIKPELKDKFYKIKANLKFATNIQEIL